MIKSILRKLIKYFLFIVSFLLLFDGVGRFVFLIIGIVENLGNNFNIPIVAGDFIGYLIIAGIGYGIFKYADKIRESDVKDKKRKDEIR